MNYSSIIKVIDNIILNNSDNKHFVTNQSVFIVIYGNIASGKTTLLNYLSNYYLHCQIIKEDLNNWSTYLDRFYKDNSSENCYHLQTVINNHFQQIEKDYYSLKLAKLVFIERSPLEAYKVFIESNKNIIHQNHLSILNDNFKKATNSTGWNQCNYLYIKSTDTKILMNRLENRNFVSGDNKITQNYLDLLDKNYQSFTFYLIQNKYKYYSIEN